MYLLRDWLHRYRWRIALILGFPAAGIAVGFLIKVAVVAPALAAAAIAGVFAWGQWHTARQKLILDLFERRSAVIFEVEELVDLSRNPSLTPMKWSVSLREVRSRIRFLFGPEVDDFLAALDDKIYLYIHAKEATGREAYEARTEEDARSLRIGGEALGDFSNDIHALCAPYLRMDQKLPRPPQEWPAAFSAWLKRKWDQPL